MRAVFVAAVLLLMIGGPALAAPAGEPPIPRQNPNVWVDGGVRNCENNFPCLPNIGLGVLAVDPGGNVFVYSFNGSYRESVKIDKPLALRGEDPRAVVVDGGASPFAIDINMTGVLVENITVTGGGRGVFVRDAAGVLLRGINVVGTTGGIAVDNAPSTTISRTTFVNVDGASIELRNSPDVVLDSLSVQGAVTGILASGADGLKITNSQVFESRGVGIEVHASTGVSIGPQANVVSDGAGIGIWAEGVTNLDVSGNVVLNNQGTGINVTGGVGVAVVNNVIEGNAISLPFVAGGGPPSPLGGTGGGLWFWETDPVLVTANVVRNNSGIGIGVGGPRSVDYQILDNVVEGNLGHGLVIEQGASVVNVRGPFTNNGGDGIFLANASKVTIFATVTGNGGTGIMGQQSIDVNVFDTRVLFNGGSRFVLGGPAPSPRQGYGGGLWFWETDPSIVQLTVAYGNAGPGITLERTTDFDLISNTVEANGAEGILLDSITRSTLSFNEITMNGFQGIRVSNAPDVPSQLAIRQNLIADNHAEGILIDSALDAIVDGNTISRNLLSGLVLGRGVGRQTVVARNAIVENGLGGSIEPFRSGVVLRSDRPVVVGPGNFIARNSLIGILVLRDFAAPASVPHLITGNVITGHRWYGILIEALSIVGFWSPNDVRITENRVFRNGFTGIVATFARGTVVGPGNVIEGNRVSGIWLYQTTGSIVAGNLVRGNGVGVDVEGASGDRVQGNTIIGNGFQGVRVFASTGLVLASNTIASSGGWNVYADGLRRSQICGNVIRQANAAGIVLVSSHGNLVCRNTLLGNGGWGVRLMLSSGNTIVLNDFVANGNQAYDDGSNAWYVPCVGGNYWSDITLGVDKKDNCLGLPFPDGRWWDAPYLIAGGLNADRFPWKFPVA